MSDTSIRPAVAADAAAINTIYNTFVTTSTATWDTEVEPVGAREKWLADRQAAGQAVLVAEVAGQVVGYAAWGPFRSKRGYARTMEHTVYVSDAAQGSGLGTALLTELIAQARLAGVHVLLGVISGDNTGSIRLHERMGFTEVGRLPQTGVKFGRWLDLVFLQLTLDDGPPVLPGQPSHEPVG